MDEAVPPDEVQMAPASYDRLLAETRTFSAEQNRLAEEAFKLVPEARKLSAEARSFDRERWAIYVAAFGGLVGGAAGVVSLLKAIH